MIVLDATILIKLLSREPGADEALERIAGEAERVAPDWIRLEIANALSRKVRSDGLSETAARAGMAAIDTFLTSESSAVSLIQDAYVLSVRLDHPVYDCLYLALAIRHEGVVVTHDRKFVAAARRAGLEASVELI